MNHLTNQSMGVSRHGNSQYQNSIFVGSPHNVIQEYQANSSKELCVCILINYEVIAGEMDQKEASTFGNKILLSFALSYNSASS
jgi:hypothetical protein